MTTYVCDYARVITYVWLRKWFRARFESIDADVKSSFHVQQFRYTNLRLDEEKEGPSISLL